MWFIPFICIFLSVIIFYWQDLVNVFNEAINSESSSHIIAIPILFTYIIYRLRNRINVSTSIKSEGKYLKIISFNQLIGIILVFIAYVIRWYSSLTFFSLELRIISLPLFISGLFLLVFNYQTLRVLIFPVSLFILLIPPPIQIVQKSGTFLATISTKTSYNILKILRLPVIFSYEYLSPIIYLKTSEGVIPFAIDIACSGLYSLTGFIIFAIFVAYIARTKKTKKLFIFLIGIPLIFALNILRITSIIIIGYYSGTNLALNLFHLLGGWTLILIATTFLLIILDKIFNINFFIKYSNFCSQDHNTGKDEACIACGKILRTHNNFNRKRTVISFIILFVIITITSIQIPSFSLVEGRAGVFTRNPSGENTVEGVLPEVEGYNPRFVYRDKQFEKVSGQNASLIYQYVASDPSKPTVWVGLEIGIAKAKLHPWELCLITYPQTHGYNVYVEQLDLRDIQLLDNPPLTARYFSFKYKNRNTSQTILYWYNQAQFKTEGGFQRKWIKTSIIQYSNNPDNYEQVEENLLPFAESIATYWNPIHQWSWLTLTLSQHSPILILISLILIAGLVGIQQFLRYNERRAARVAYNSLRTRDDKNIIDAVKELGKPCSNKEVQDELQEKGISYSLEEIEEKLQEAKQVGLLERKLVSINDEPYFLWTTRF